MSLSRRIFTLGAAVALAAPIMPAAAGEMLAAEPLDEVVALDFTAEDRPIFALWENGPVGNRILHFITDDEGEAMRWAHEAGLTRQAGEDEGGADYAVLLPEAEIVRMDLPTPFVTAAAELRSRPSPPPGHLGFGRRMFPLPSAEAQG